MNLDERLKRLEQRRVAAKPFGGAVVFVMTDGGTVTACRYCPPIRPDVGLVGFYGAMVWRHRDTCPDAVDCELAPACCATGEPVNSSNSPTE